MNRFGWTLHVTKEQQQPILATLRERICFHLNFCASVACSCVTGKDEPKLCTESEAGVRYPILHSEGPTWVVYVRALESQIIIDVHTSGPRIQWEVRELYRELCKLGYPIFVHVSASELP